MQSTCSRASSAIYTRNITTRYNIAQVYRQFEGSEHVGFGIYSSELFKLKASLTAYLDHTPTQTTKIQIPPHGLDIYMTQDRCHWRPEYHH